MAEEKKEGAAPAAAAPKDTKLILILVLLVIDLGVMGGATFYFFKSTLGWHAPEITEKSLEEQDKGHPVEESGPLIYTMDKFTVNLNGEPRRTVRLEVNLEMLDKNGFEEIMTHDNRAKARDLIVRILNDKNFSEIETIQGKLFLKDQISKEINQILTEGVVKDVYFSELVVQ